MSRSMLKSCRVGVALLEPLGSGCCKPKRENDTMGNNIRSSSRPKALAPSIPMPPLADAMDAVHLSVDRFCPSGRGRGLGRDDGGGRHDRVRGPTSPPWGPRGYRWGRTHSEIGYHGGKVKVARPRVRDRAGKEVSLESWQAITRWQPAARVGAQPDGAERVDPQVPPRGPSARGRPGESAWRRHLEVGRFPALCGAVTQEDEGLARLGSLGTRPASHPDRRSACRRPC